VGRTRLRASARSPPWSHRGVKSLGNSSLLTRCVGGCVSRTATTIPSNLHFRSGYPPFFKAALRNRAASFWAGLSRGPIRKPETQRPPAAQWRESQVGGPSLLRLKAPSCRQRKRPVIAHRPEGGSWGEERCPECQGSRSLAKGAAAACAGQHRPWSSSRRPGAPHQPDAAIMVGSGGDARKQHLWPSEQAGCGEGNLGRLAAFSMLRCSTPLARRRRQEYQRKQQQPSVAGLSAFFGRFLPKLGGASRCRLFLPAREAHGTAACVMFQQDQQHT
jgi:hypothetical protein